MEDTDFSYVGVWLKFERAPCYRKLFIHVHGQYTFTELLRPATRILTPDGAPSVVLCFEYC